MKKEYLMWRGKLVDEMTKKELVQTIEEMTSYINQRLNTLQEHLYKR